MLNHIGIFFFALVWGIGCSKPDGPRRIPGTYKISACKIGQCTPGDSTRAVAAGTLVLLDSSYTWEALPDSARELLGKVSYTVAPLNGCYVLASNVGATHWERDSLDMQTIQLLLSNSPDSWYVARLKSRGRRLEGTANYSGSGAAAAPGRPRDTVVATRIGEPDLSLCIDASLRTWRQLRGVTPPNTR